MRTGAGASMARWAAAALLGMIGLASCADGAGESTVVRGVEADDFLRVRAGPGLGFDVILGLPDGARVTRRGCVTEGGQLWCKIALGDAPGLSGYVSADYLSAP